MARPDTAAVRLLSGEREPVRVATTANITLSGLQTIDGVVLVAGDRVLVLHQTDATENGIYTASSGTWYRASDARSTRSINKGVTVRVQSGTVSAGLAYTFQTLNPDIGDDDIDIEAVFSDGEQVTEILASDYGVLAGEVNSSVKIQAALDAAALITGGARVRLGYGTFNLLTSVTVTKSGVELVGGGMGTVVVLSSNAALKIAHASVEVRNAAIRDICVTSVSGFDATKANVILSNARRCQVTGLYFLGLRGDAIWNGDAVASASASFIANNWATAETTARHGMWFQSVVATGDHIVTGNCFNGQAGLGSFIKLGGADIDGIIINGNEGTAFNQGFLLDGVNLSNANVIGNTFDCGTGTDDTVQLFLDSGSGLHDVKFIGNQINGYQASGTAKLMSVVCPTGAAIQGLTINGNQFSSSRGHALSITQTGSGTVYGWTVSGNTFDVGGRAATNTYSAIFASGNQPGVVITANQIFNNGSQNWGVGIDVGGLDSANFPVILGNVASQCSAGVLNLNATQQSQLNIFGNQGTVSGDEGGSPQFAQAWFSYNLNTQTLIDSFNITSVTRTGTGLFDFVVTNALTEAGTCSITARGGFGTGYMTSTTAGTGGTYNTSVALFNSENVQVVVYGRRGG